jgi:putative ABC transport system permease protein
LFILLLKKIKNNIWLSVCLILGSILSVALIGSIPMTSSALLQRALVKDMEGMQNATGNYPGNFMLNSEFNDVLFEPGQRGGVYSAIKRNFADNLPDLMGLPVISKTNILSLVSFKSTPEKRAEDDTLKTSIEVKAVSGIESHVKLTNGRMFSNKSNSANEIIEAIVTEQAMKDKKLLLDNIYILNNESDKTLKSVKIKIVGVFTYADPADVFWSEGIDQFKSGVVISYNQTIKKLSEVWGPILRVSSWQYSFDYHKIRIDDISALLSRYNRIEDAISKYRGTLSSKFSLVDTLKQYQIKNKQITINLIVLFFPVIVMIILYLAMISLQLVENDRNEISLMQSRGASGIQTLSIYLFESLFFAGISLAAGPFLSLGLCKLLGISNGFLEFVNRKGIDFSLSTQSYLYSVVGALIIVFTISVPAIFASKVTIVQHKKNLSRFSKLPLWKKSFIDIIMILISVYGLYNFQNRQKVLFATGVKGTDVQVDILLYISTTLFILGAGLLLIRLYPYFIKILFLAGKKFLSPVPYAALVQIGRSSGKEQFLMLFLILTIAGGIFNANSARTVNTNVEEKVKYEFGADIIVNEYWESNEAPKYGVFSEEGPRTTDGNPLKYIEPDFTPFTKLKSVDAAKVYANPITNVLVGNNAAKNVKLMGINPYEFGMVAWFRQGLLPYHIYEYLNLLSDTPAALLVSRSFKDKYGARIGDTVSLRWGNDEQKDLDGVIYAFIDDLWPTYMSYKAESNEKADLVVANLSYINACRKIEPYQIWLKKKSGVTDSEVDSELKGNIASGKMDIEDIKYSDKQILEDMRDVRIQAVNGSSTASFVIAIVICFMGFLIYWLISVKRRFLFFGILRALGMKQKSIFGLIALEQFLITGVSVLFGMIIGIETGDLFIKFLQMSFSSAQQVPPFRIVSYWQDYAKLFITVAVMLVTGLSVLMVIISRLRIDQALKLGED